MKVSVLTFALLLLVPVEVVCDPLPIPECKKKVEMVLGVICGVCKKLCDAFSSIPKDKRGLFSEL